MRNFLVVTFAASFLWACSGDPPKGDGNKAAVEDRALLRLDANQGWSAKQAVHAMHALEDAGIAEPHRSAMMAYFERTATFLINRD